MSSAQDRASSYLVRLQRRLSSLARRGARRFPLSARQAASLLKVLPGVTILGSLPAKFSRLVIFVSHEMSLTGAPQVVLDIATICRRQHWAVVVIAPDDGPRAAQFVDAGAVVVISPDALWDTSPALLFERDADLLFCNTIVTFAAARRWRAPKILYTHETRLLRDMAASYPSLAAELNAMIEVWAPSPLSVAECRFLGVEAKLVDVTAADIFAPPPSGPKARGILLGSIEPRKGQDILVNAIARLPREIQDQMSIDLYGKVLDPSFAEKVTAASAGGPVTYRGLTSSQDALDQLIAADFMIVPSRDEPLPLTAVEALSAGRPIITSQASGISTYLVDGVSGFIAPEPTPEALGAVIERAFKNRGRWPEISLAARQVYEKHFTAQRFKTEVLARLQAAMAAG